MVESEGCPYIDKGELETKVGLARGGLLLRLLPGPVESSEGMFQLN